jgi:carbon storage regulator
MLVLSRKLGERIHIGANIVVTVVALDGHRIRLGIEAPRDVHIRRAELADQPLVLSAEPCQRKEPSHASGHPPSGR